jgi:hypothetical protein
MTSDGDYAAALRAAERELAAATTAEDVRRVWKTHFGVLGHRALGRLLLGRSATELAARRTSRQEAG